MIKIKLLGELKDEFIDEFEAEVKNAAEVISCLKANFPTFVEYLVDSAARGIGFHLKVGYQEIGEDQLSHPFSKKVESFTLTAIPSGSGGNVGKILLGGILLGVGLLSGGVGFLGLSSSTLILTGAAMVLGGIAGFFGKTKSPSDDEREGKKSLVFGGGTNTITEGNRISIVYGRHRVGMTVLSARIYSFAA